MKKNLVGTIAVIAAITIAATTMTFAGITTITQQANAQPSNTGTNIGICTNTGIQACSISQGMCQLAQQGGRDNTGIINNSECS